MLSYSDFKAAVREKVPGAYGYALPAPQKED